MATQDLGRITAYADAVAGGYTGTQEEFEAALASVSNKVDKVTGKQLSTEDYTTTEKNKLASISDDANNYALPEAGALLGGVKTGGDVTISSGVITVNTANVFATAIIT